MKAYDLYRQDRVNGQEFLRSTLRERRQYYVLLRQALRDACDGGGTSALLESFGERMAAGQLPQLYLLDAGAVWECYEGAVEGYRNTRDIGRGFPFPVNGRTLGWAEVQRMSEEGTLPAAVVDLELQSRLTALLQRTERPPVNLRATLRTAEAPRADLSRTEAAASPSDPGALQEAARQLEALRKKNAELQEQLTRLQSNQELTRDYAIRAAGSILAGKTEEAHAAASRLEDSLQEAVRELEAADAGRRELQSRFEQAQTALAADQAQRDALLRQAQDAEQAAAIARDEREQAQRAARQASAERQAAQQELQDALALLEVETDALRKLRRKVSDAHKARLLTQRQIGELT